MPSFYPQPIAGHFPPTPPYNGSFDDQQCTSDTWPKHVPAQHRVDSALDYPQRYQLPQSSAQQHSYQRATTYEHNLPPINSYYELIGAPILPPLRMQGAWGLNNGSFYNNLPAHQPPVQTHHPQQQPPKKEDQATGGVSAKLDYDMDQMVDFVSEVTQGIIQPGVNVHPSFRKWVSQVLAATRLPSSTILLSLHYLTVRMRQHPTSIQQSDQQPYRLLAVSLILGSKFLDDNTFINRSWSDVSGIKVTELNALEMQWLALIGFDLHADHEDENGVSLWLRAWKDYESRAKAKAHASTLLALNTNVQRYNTLGSSNTSYQSTPSRLAHESTTPLSSSSMASNASTPYTSADPWNRSTPTWSTQYSQTRYPQSYNPSTANTFTGRFGVDTHTSMGSQHYHHYSLPALSSLTPTYFSTPWNNNTWEHQHAWGCRCGCSSRMNTFNPSASFFAPQTVVG